MHVHSEEKRESCSVSDGRRSPRCWTLINWHGFVPLTSHEGKSRWRWNSGMVKAAQPLSGESRIPVSTPGHEERIRCCAVRGGRRRLQPYARAVSECRARVRLAANKAWWRQQPLLMKISAQISTAKHAHSDDTMSVDNNRWDALDKERTVSKTFDKKINYVKIKQQC